MKSDNRSLPDEPAPIVSSGADLVGPRNRDLVPAPEKTAQGRVDVANWERIAAADDFKALLRAKRRFIIPATLFFLLYYFALPYLVGYHTAFMQRKVWGEMNLAYLFALSQFFMAWMLAAVYVIVASRWDRRARKILDGTR